MCSKNEFTFSGTFPLPPLDKMAAPTCIAIVKSTLEVCGKACRGGEYCGTHQRQQQKEVERYGVCGPTQCQYIGNGRCGETKVEGRHLCERHWHTFRQSRGCKRIEAYLDNRVAQVMLPNNRDMDKYAIVDAIVTPVLHQRILDMSEGVLIPTKHAHLQLSLIKRIGHFHADPRMTHNTAFVRHNLCLYVIHQWRTHVQQFNVGEFQPIPEVETPVLPPLPPPPPQQPELARIANDAQNTHTRVVSEATNKATTILLDRIKHLDHKKAPTHWMDWLAIEWLTTCKKHYGPMSFVIQDMSAWWQKSECRVRNDYLYRRVLLGVLDVIQKETDKERQAELLKRLYEECREAKGMCCEGHIARLCNVFVGFDEAFQPPMSVGEQLQQEMSAIAMRTDIDDEEKRELARYVLDRLQVPQAQRQDWLEAF